MTVDGLQGLSWRLAGDSGLVSWRFVILHVNVAADDLTAVGTIVAARKTAQETTNRRIGLVQLIVIDIVWRERFVIVTV